MKMETEAGWDTFAETNIKTSKSLFNDYNLLRGGVHVSLGECKVCPRGTQKWE